MRPEDLLHALADGEPRSGEDLARRFGVTRAAVWKHARRLQEWGLAVHAAPGLGYQLARRIDLLDLGSLRSRLGARVASRIDRLEVFTELGSTNRHLLDRMPPQNRLAVCLAEYQRAGRGRRGRHWTAPLGSGLCLSVGWQFADTPRDLSALTLAVGVVARRVLESAAGVRIELKWPNDLVWDGRKLGGILVELRAEAHGGCHVVIGLGINVAMPADALGTVSDWPRGAADLNAATNGAPPRRETIAADLIGALFELLAGYEAGGFSPYRGDWRAADYLLGRRVTLDDPSGAVSGTALGIEADGALLVETAAGARRRVTSGDVSVRSA